MPHHHPPWGRGAMGRASMRLCTQAAMMHIRWCTARLGLTRRLCLCRRTAGCIAVVLTRNGHASSVISKYRPPCPVIAISDNDQVLRQANIM